MNKKKKTVSAIIIIFGVLLILFGILAPFLSVNNSLPSTGIIGGAGAPTYWFLFFRMWGGACTASVLIGFAAVMAGMLVLWMTKTYEK